LIEFSEEAAPATRIKQLDFGVDLNHSADIFKAILPLRYRGNC